MKLWKWQNGRQQDCEYEKFPLWYFTIGRWGLDAYILRYPPLAVLPEHKDPIEDGRHYRFNLKLRGYSLFGKKIEGKWQFTEKLCNLFRADLIEHMLLVGMAGCLKLSIGLAIFNKKQK